MQYSMNRILLSQYEQLKCNFCTQWFSVHTQYAILQKYSLNACQKCIENFPFHIVHPNTYEIYDVMLVKTGIHISSREQYLYDKYQALLNMHRQNVHINQQQYFKLKQEIMQLHDQKDQLDAYVQPIKEKISEICHNFVSGMLKHWNCMLGQIQKSNTEYKNTKQKLIKALKNKYYNFLQDPQKLLCPLRINNDKVKYKQIDQGIRKITAEKMIIKIKKFINQFLKKFMKLQGSDGQYLLETTNKLDQNNRLGQSKYENYNRNQNKENKTPNDKKQLRSIREKLMKISRRNDQGQNQQRVLDINNMVNNQHIHKSTSNSSLKTNIKTSRKQLNKSSNKNLLQLLKPQVPPLNLKQESFYTSKNTVKTPRSNLPQYEIAQRPHLIIDDYRDQMSRLIKQKSQQITTYMPIQIQKSEQFCNRTYGQRCLIEYLVELKMKTTINQNICELINQNLSKGNILCYLKSLQWNQNIKMIRFVKVKMHDPEFNTFLNWFRQKINVEILVLSNNFLTELSLEALYSFCLRHRDLKLKQVYMGNNYIKHCRVRKFIQELRRLGVQVHV